jgi:hypothetical protein
MEREQKRSQNEHELVQSEAIKKIGDSALDFLLAQELSAQEKALVLEKTASVVHDIFEASKHHVPVEVVVRPKDQGLKQKSGDIFMPQSQPERGAQTLDLSEIPRWRGRKQDGMPLDFIQAHYGKWLTAFGAEQDAIFQDQIRRHDKRLITAIENQLREERRDRKVRDFLKPRSARLDRELASFTPDALKHAERLRAALRKRQAKEQANPKASSQ